MLNALRKFEFWVWKTDPDQRETMNTRAAPMRAIPRRAAREEALVLFDLIEATGLGGRVRASWTSSTAGSPGYPASCQS